MKKNRKCMMLSLLLVLSLCLAACGKEGSSGPAEPAESEVSTAAETKAAAEPETTAAPETTAEPETTAAAETSAESAAAAGSEASAAFGKPAGTVSGVEQSELLDVYKLELLEGTNVFSLRESSRSYYKLVDADRNALTDKDFVYLSGENGFITFALDSEETNCTGLMDTDGNVLIPDVYGEIDVFSDRWAAGINLADATESNYDYFGFGGGHYLIDHVDIFYCGSKVGTLEREGYKNAHGFGDFIYINDRSNNSHFYDRTFAEAEPKYEYGSNEYYYDSGSKTVWHLGSGTAAFTAGCTLTPDQVECSVYEQGGALLDLQGNVIASTAEYSYVYPFENGYAKIADRADKCGILRADGTVISECVYDSIDLYDQYIPTGYVPGVKDGKFCIISLEDGSAAVTDYVKDALKYAYAPFASKVMDDGKTAVITPCGVLEETFDDVSVVYDSKPVTIVGTDGAYGVIDMSGKYVVEPESGYDYSWKLSVSADGKLVLGEAKDGYYIYKLTY